MRISYLLPLCLILSVLSEDIQANSYLIQVPLVIHQ